MFDRAKSDDYFSVGGASVANGFDLQFSTVLGYTRTATFRVPNTTEGAERRFDWFNAAILSALLVAAWSNYVLWPKVFTIVLLWNTTDALLERSYKGWHWVEHQAALWLEGDTDGRFDNINPISTRCGLTYDIAQALMFAAIAMTWDYGFIGALVCLSALATMRVHLINRLALVFRPWVRKALVVIAWPTAVICLGMQRMLYMRRPSPAQREWAKRWALELAPIIAQSLLKTSPPRIVKIVSRKQM